MAVKGHHLQLNKQKVLIVEDEIIIAMDLADILRDAGAEVVGPAALAVPEALRLIDSNEVSLAVLDVQLGTDNSKSVAHRLAEADIPYVFHTGNLRRHCWTGNGRERRL